MMLQESASIEVLQEEILVHPNAILINDIWRIDARISGKVVFGGKRYTFERVVDVYLNIDDDQS